MQSLSRRADVPTSHNVVRDLCRRFFYLPAIFCLALAASLVIAAPSASTEPAATQPAAGQSSALPIAEHPSSQPAAQLAARLPADTVAFFGWNPEQGLGTTRLAQMLADEQFMRPLRGLIQSQLLAMPDDVGGAKISDNIPKMIDDITHCPGCFALLRMTPGRSSLQPQALLMLQLGDRAAAFRDHFQPIHERLKQRLGDSMKMMKLDNSWLWYKMERGQVRYTWGFVGDSFVFFWGSKGPDILTTIFSPKTAKSGPSLADNPNFSGGLAEIPPPSGLAGKSLDPAYVSYIDMAVVPPILKTLLNQPDQPDLQALLAKTPALLDAIGLDNAKALVGKTYIVGGQFITSTLLRTDGPPHGLLSQAIQTPVDDAMLKCIPPDAMLAAAVHIDLSKFYGQLKAAAIAVGGDDASKAFLAFEGGGWAMGLSPKQALEPLGDQWVLYSAASTGGSALTGWTLVGSVKNPKKLQAAIESLRRILATVFGNDASATVAEETVGGVKIQTLQFSQMMSPVSPSWAVAGDRIIVALYPQLVEDAIRRLKAPRSILDNPDFLAARQRVGSGSPMYYYSGSELTKSIYPWAPIIMSAAQAWAPAMDTDANQHSPDTNWVMLLPSLQRLLQYVGTDMGSVKLMPDGILRTRTQANPLLSPLVVTDLLPLAIFTVDSDQAPSGARQKSAANLQQIGQGFLMYANENKGQFPPDAATMARAEAFIPEEVFKSPFGRPTAGPPYVYCYFKGMNASMPADIIIAYDGAELEQEEATTVLFADGHVDYLEADAFKQAMAKSKTLQADVEKHAGEGK